jgi:hypothetical protein
VFVPVTITANGEAVYSTGFDMLASESRDQTIPLSGIGSRLVESVGAQFGTEGSHSGHPWVQLSERYGKWKESRVPGLPILVGIRPESKGTREKPHRPQTYVPSGRMRRELLDMASVRTTPTRMVYAPVSDIAGYHQDGTPKMPARPPVDLTLTELHEWDRIYVRWMNGLIAQASLG